jgi:arginase family enzyme
VRIVVERSVALKVEEIGLGADVAVLGVPFDSGVSYRPGALLGVLRNPGRDVVPSGCLGGPPGD